MVVGPATRRFIESRRNPGGVALDVLHHMQETAAEMAKLGVDKALAESKGEATAEIKKEGKRLQAELRKLSVALIAEFKIQFRKKIDSVPHLKGDDGHTPEKGVDYDDGNPGDDGYTPIPDVDYPSLKTFNANFEKAKEELFSKILEALPKENDIAEVVLHVFEKTGYAAIARGIESLTVKDKLDYYRGLKNQPDIPLSEQRDTLHRGGGGKQTYTYDLSDLCDDTTKVFTVPINTRILQVVGTDSPAGAYRLGVDWTGSGTTTLTLTDEVAAPTTGATLYILYVV